MEEVLRNPQKTVKKRNPKINDYQTGDDRRGMTRPIRPVQEFHKRKGQFRLEIYDGFRFLAVVLKLSYPDAIANALLAFRMGKIFSTTEVVK